LYLLDHGANPDADSLSALFNAVLFDEQDIVNVILKKTRFPNAANFSMGISPLIIAAYNEHDNTRMMQILIDHGADVNYKAPDGSTPLSWAIKKGNSKAVVLLRQAGAK
jgi:ankyrin repeat protein